MQYVGEVQNLGTQLETHVVASTSSEDRETPGSETVLGLLTATILEILQTAEAPVISAVDVNGLSFAGRSVLCVAVLSILTQRLNLGQARLPP